MELNQPLNFYNLIETHRYTYGLPKHFITTRPWYSLIILLFPKFSNYSNLFIIKRSLTLNTIHELIFVIMYWPLVIATVQLKLMEAVQLFSC